MKAAAPTAAKVEEKMDPAGLEFFEKNVRPILSERCYKCHSAAESTSKGGLVLDSRAAMLDGGDVPKRAIGDVNAHRALLEELDKVAAGDGVSEPTR